MFLETFLATVYTPLCVVYLLCVDDIMKRVQEQLGVRPRTVPVRILMRDTAVQQSNPKTGRFQKIEIEKNRHQGDTGRTPPSSPEQQYSVDKLTLQQYIRHDFVENGLQLLCKEVVVGLKQL